jgi:hypothetical protein
MGTYRGNFKNGVKDGEGIFLFANNVRYEGTYKNGVKEGRGTIYTKDNNVAYDGEMKKGLPHGRGCLVGKNGEKRYYQFREGISISEQS